MEKRNNLPVQNEENVILGAEQLPYISEKINEESLEKGNNMRSLVRPVRNAVLALGLALAAARGVDKAHEYRNLKSEIELADQGISKLDSLEKKVFRIRELFGEHVDLDRFYVLEMNIIKTKMLAEEKFAKFSLFFDSQSEGGPISRFEIFPDRHNKDEELLKPDSIEFSDIKFFRIPSSSSLRGESIKTKVSYSHFMEIVSERLFPKGAIKGEIRYFIQTDKEGEMRLDYYNNEVPKGVQTLADCSTFRSDKNIITFYKPMANKNIFGFIEVVAHEVAHANDWNTDNELSVEERCDLLLSIANRVRSADRYETEYVESISNEDKQLQLYNKCVEYWAEIYSQYILSPEYLHYEDFVIVDTFIKKADPNFQPKIFSNQQDELFTIIHDLSNEN